MLSASVLLEALGVGESYVRGMEIHSFSAILTQVSALAEDHVDAMPDEATLLCCLRQLDISPAFFGVLYPAVDREFTERIKDEGEESAMSIAIDLVTAHAEELYDEVQDISVEVASYDRAHPPP